MELKDLQKIDHGRMYEYYDRWPDIAKQMRVVVISHCPSIDKKK